MLIGPLGTNFSEILIGIKTFSFKKMPLKMSSAKWRPFCLGLNVLMFVVVNFDALAQASDIRIERRQVVFRCWMQDSNPRSQTPIRQQTECLLTNWLSYRGSSKNLNSTARPYDQRAFSPLDLTASWLSHLALAIYMFVVVNFDALAQASDIRIQRRQVVFRCWMQDSNPRSQTQTSVKF